MIQGLYQRSKKLLFLLPAERAHYLSLFLFQWLYRIPFLWNLVEREFALEDERLETKVAGLTFKNPVGLAAGFDKDGKYMHLMAGLGFGFLELGTVTPKPQSGNPKPRLFRLPGDRALINRLGFNNEGVDALVRRLRAWQKPDGLIIGGNIGKNKVTPNDQAVHDYRICFEKLHPYVDYFVVNVSSPNTPGLRELQSKDSLGQILLALMDINRAQAIQRPVFLKIAPDLTKEALKDVVDIAVEMKIAGIVCNNTTIAREPLTVAEEQVMAIGAGGLSGAPLYEKSNEILSQLKALSPDQLSIIGVGGIDKPTKALIKMELGAPLVQLYSGMVFYGPGLVRDIKKTILGKN